ncbi:TPA: class B sortase [Bacillus cereus]|uniref:class B sortase n=1 Tax=Bacillus cereus group TaxID=86661 RepID=UPI0010BEC117|nr:class B sortase [Bacillus cereus]TKH76036.1 class B sortase [Bacillus cereus]HDR4872685.1 class B sortase [Bacillus cereus]HDR8472517.1 class B sortase [Bacillus cereus]
MNSKNGRKKNSFFQRILTIVFLGIFFYSMYELGGIFMDYYENRKVMAEAQHIYKRSPMEEKSEDGEVRKQFQDLQKINPEIVGWITMDDTQINYPIVQAKDNDYYLFRNYKGEDMRAGSIFMDHRNDVKSQNRNTILYGHRMKDGSMFGSLKKMLDEDFFMSHRKLYYDTLFEGYDVEVFSVYTTTTDFYYIETDFENDAVYTSFLKEVQEKSLYKTDTELTANDEIVTLSTCDYALDPEAGRLVIHAKLVKRN